jgi:Bacterial EndoU nuclease
MQPPLLPYMDPITTPYDCKAGPDSRTVTVNGTSNTWTYNANLTSPYGEKITDPNGNDEVHVFSVISLNNAKSPNTVEVQVNNYKGSSASGTLLKQVVTDYTGEPDAIEPQLLVNLRPIRKTITLDNGLVAKTETDYETFSIAAGAATRLNPIEVREFAYGTGSPGALMRKTDYTYLHNNNSSYATLNIVDRVASTTAYAGNQVAQTTYEYDVYNHTSLPSMGSILDGDATGGGHAPGTGVPGKSEFPAGWSRDKIMNDISDVATDPASKVTQAGRTTLIDGTRDGVNIRVVVRDGRIVTGYPTNLPRNP